MPAVTLTADQSHAIEKAWLQIVRDWPVALAYLNPAAFEQALTAALGKASQMEDLQAPASASWVPDPLSPIGVPFTVEVFQLGNLQACRLDLGLLGAFYLRLKGE